MNQFVSRLAGSAPRGVGGFRFERVLGNGATGRVYAAVDGAVRVAVKIAHADLALAPAAIERFEREFEAARRIDSPWVVKPRRSGSVEGRPWIAMDLVDGPSLRELLHSTGPLPIADAARVGRAVALALQAAHDAGVVHRDIKPANVLIDRDGAIRVSDFGVAYLEAAATLTATGGLAGSPQYAAPETYVADPSPASDVYSLGAMLYEVLTGAPPFEGASPLDLLRSKVQPPMDLRVMRAEVPEGLATLIGRMMAPDPVDRPEPAAVAEAMLAWSAGGDALDRALLDQVPAREVDLVRVGSRRGVMWPGWPRP